VVPVAPSSAPTLAYKIFVLTVLTYKLILKRDNLTRFCGKFLVLIDRSEVPTHKERVRLHLKFQFRVEFLDLRVSG
jgi:hypothetical protein